MRLTSTYWRLSFFCAAALLAFASGCATCYPTIPCACDRGTITANVAGRTDLSLSAADYPGEVMLPNGASLEDGLEEAEAALIALWNNAAFQELLTDLEIAHADLVQAELLPNPEFVFFFPVTDKPYKYAFDLPLEAFWLRPLRVASASRETERVCERLTQAALDLIRDTRQAYADVLLAKGRIEVAAEAVKIRRQIAALANARLEAGDIGVQEAATAKIDVLIAEQDLARQQYDVALAESRLRNWMGVGDNPSPLELDATPPPIRGDFSAVELTAEATASRPDALAAEQATIAAAERLRLAEVGWIRFLGILDATSGTSTGHEFGPAFRTTLPLFNWNEGQIARAQAELNRAARQRQTVHDRIILEVRLAHDRYAQARAEMQILATQVRPEVEAAIRRAKLAYREGNAPYVVVLETTRQLLDSRNREQQLWAELRRAWAELERSVGRQLESPPIPDPEPLPAMERSTDDEVPLP